jgi:hypothetical protein
MDGLVFRRWRRLVRRGPGTLNEIELERVKGIERSPQAPPAILVNG